MIVDDEIIWSSQSDNDPVPHATTSEFDGDSRAAVVWGCDIRTCIVFSTRAFIKQKRRSRTRWFLLVDSGEEIIQLPRGGNWGGIFNYTPTTPNMRWWLGALFLVPFFLWLLRKLNPLHKSFSVLLSLNPSLLQHMGVRKDNMLICFCYSLHVRA